MVPPIDSEINPYMKKDHTFSQAYAKQQVMTISVSRIQGAEYALATPPLFTTTPTTLTQYVSLEAPVYAPKTFNLP